MFIISKCMYTDEIRMAAWCRIATSEEANFLTVSMVTFRDNKRTLYGIIQYVLTCTTTTPTQNSITITTKNFTQ